MGFGVWGEREVVQMGKGLEGWGYEGVPRVDLEGGMGAKRVGRVVKRVGRGFGGLVVVIGTSYCEVSKNTHQYRKPPIYSIYNNSFTPK